MATPNTIDYFAIRNALARYTLCLDSRDFEALKKVFTPDAVTFYPMVGEMTGVDELIKVITKRCRLHFFPPPRYAYLYPITFSPL